MASGARFRSFATRTRDVVLAAALVGAITGFVVALCSRLTLDGLFLHVLDLPLWAIALMPVVGLTLAYGCLRLLSGVDTMSVSDEYIRNFHDTRHDLDVRKAPGGVIASILTIGFGGALGLEGLALYAGSAVGTVFQQRLRRLFRPVDAKLLMVAGAAAGVAAIFKAPATGAVFALEVPFQDDLARRRLIPALVASATGYLAFVAVNGTEPLFRVRGPNTITTTALVGAVALGLTAGVGARAFAWLLRTAKGLQDRIAPATRIIAGGAMLAALFAAGRALTGRSFVLGPGYESIHWAVAPNRAIPVVLGLLVLRCLATGATVAGGGTGGLFIPLVVAGALLGRAVAGIAGELDDTLFLAIGVSAFLGAGYRVPLAAVMFVAEATGRPGFVVPALLAAVAADLVMGRASVTTYQMPRDPGTTLQQPPSG